MNLLPYKGHWRNDRVLNTSPLGEIKTCPESIGRGSDDVGLLLMLYDSLRMRILKKGTVNGKQKQPSHNNNWAKYKVGGGGGNRNIGLANLQTHIIQHVIEIA